MSTAPNKPLQLMARWHVSQVILSLQLECRSRAAAEASVGRLPSRSDKHREKRSDAMHILEHLFLVGEFPARAR